MEAAIGLKPLKIGNLVAKHGIGYKFGGNI